MLHLGARLEHLFYTALVKPEYREEPCRTALNKVIARWHALKAEGRTLNLVVE